MIRGFTLCYRRCLNGSGLFPLFMHFLETKMTKSPPIIVSECIFKDQNFCLKFCVALYVCIPIFKKISYFTEKL